MCSQSGLLLKSASYRSGVRAGAELGWREQYGGLAGQAWREQCGGLTGQARREQCGVVAGQAGREQWVGGQA